MLKSCWGKSWSTFWGDSWNVENVPIPEVVVVKKLFSIKHKIMYYQRSKASRTRRRVR
jgi:hypothetical protein